MKNMFVKYAAAKGYAVPKEVLSDWYEYFAVKYFDCFNNVLLGENLDGDYANFFS